MFDFDNLLMGIGDNPIMSDEELEARISENKDEIDEIRELLLEGVE